MSSAALFPVLLPPARPLQSTAASGECTWRVFTPRTASWIILAFCASTAFGQSVGPTERATVLSLLAKWFPLVFQGFLFNLVVSLLAMIVGTALGALLGLGLISRSPVMRRSSWVVTQFFRNAPWLVLLFYTMFLLPFEFRIGGLLVPFPAWSKAVAGLSLPVMANVAEIVRGGVQSIPTAQWDSAESLAFSRRQTLWMIILPQALQRMIPPWMNQYAILTMATTLISIVGIQDGLTIARAALVAEARTDLLIPMYLMLLLMFFAYCYPIARWTLMLERRVAVKI